MERFILDPRLSRVVRNTHELMVTDEAYILEKATAVSAEELRSIKLEAARCLNVPTISFVDALQHEVSVRQCVSCGCPGVDQLLQFGGFASGTITEFAGLSSTGKTQLAFFSILTSLCLSEKATALYVDATNSFSASRLKELFDGSDRFLSFREAGHTFDHVFERIRVSTCFDAYEFLDCMFGLQAAMCKQDNEFACNMTLIVIDSVGALFSPVVGTGSTGIEFKTINHAVLARDDAPSGQSLSGMDMAKTRLVSHKPALGIQWATRIPTQTLFFTDPSTAAAGAVVCNKESERWEFENRRGQQVPMFRRRVEVLSGGEGAVALGTWRYLYIGTQDIVSFPESRSLVGRIIVGTGVAALGAYGLFRYAMYKLEESEVARQRAKAANQKLLVRFRQNQRDSVLVVEKLASVLAVNLAPLCNVEDITVQLQELRKSVAESDLPLDEVKALKMRLWESLKITAFTRSLSSIYLINLLNIFTVVQLNMLAKFAFVASVCDEANNLSDVTERAFLSMAWYLLNKGLLGVVERVKVSVQVTLSEVSVSADISWEELSAFIRSIRKQIELSDNFHSFVLPPKDEESDVLLQASSSEIESLFGDQDLNISSVDFTSVLKESLDASFEWFFDQLQRTIFPGETAGGKKAEEKIAEILEEAKDRRVKLATCLPTVSKFSTHILADDENRLLQAVGREAGEVLALGAVVYTDWDDDRCRL
ncbi:peroxin [Entophlyctis sp. JEL0112]|nr:peroxin [Entophlyctis sp. JEL0112]